MKITVYSKDNCPYCEAAKGLLKDKKLAFEEINLQHKPDELAALKARTGMRTVPQIFFDEQLIGGFTELKKLADQGLLDQKD
ncbi:glutaredoxin family protein [bacterium]|nr:glutaredoxin family protein [bacterium]